MYTLSAYSRGPVADSENIHLVITDPQAFDPRSGKLLPVMFDQVFKKGLSALREGAADTEFETTYRMLKANSDARGRERFFHGVCSFRAKKLRYDGNRQVVGIYDTAYEDRNHHVDILAPRVSRHEVEKLKKKFIDDIGSALVEVSRFRDGVFAEHARPS